MSDAPAAVPRDDMCADVLRASDTSKFPWAWMSWPEEATEFAYGIIDALLPVLTTYVERVREEALEGAAYIAETYAPPDDTYPVTPYGACQAVAEAIRARKTAP